MKSLIQATLILLIVNCFFINNSTAQISINSDGSNPDASAMLDVTSTDKGMLIPRMDSTSRKNIANPAIGLMVYDSTTNSFWYYANSDWNNISAILSDADGDTKIQVEENSDDDIIRFDLGGTEFMRLDSGRIEILNTGSSVFIGEGAGANDDYDDNENVFIGHQSGYSNTEGRYNTFQGYQSGYSNTEGNSNSFIGNQSGYSNIDGNINVFIGYQSGYSNTTGNGNIFQGYRSGYLNTTGSYNIFQGYQSGYSNTTGSNNNFIGIESGYSNTDGAKNTFLGYQSGYSNTLGTTNLFQGYRSGYSNTIGLSNLFQGAESGYSNINGSFNTFQGYQSGFNNTNGHHNIFQGYQSGFNNTTGYGNVFQGTQSGFNNTTGYGNVFQGILSGFWNTSGKYNTFLGGESGSLNTEGDYNIFLGYQSGLNNTTGNSNTFLGVQSGFNTTGDKNVFLGYRAGFNETGSNKLYIDNSDTNTPLIYGDFDSDTLQINGALSIRDSITLYGEAKFNEPVYINKSLGGLNAFTFTLENLNNKNNAYNNGINILAGQTSANYNSLKQGDFIRFTTPDSIKIGSIYQDAAGSIALTTTSDIRLKTNIQTSQYGLADILNIQVRDYQYKSDAAQTPQTGFIAQQLHEVFPVAVRVGGDNAKTNPWTVDYSKLTPLLVKGMQEQQDIIDELTMDNGQLTMENETQNKRLQALETQNKKLEIQVSKIEQLEQQVSKIKELEAKLEALLQNQQ